MKVLKYFNLPEGYFEVTSTSGNVNGDYVYQYKDHIGSIRLSYSDTNNNGSISANTEIIEESNYYPFGLKHKGYNNVVTSGGNSQGNKYGFQGIELEEFQGFNLHEMEFRQYDPAIARFTSIDPVTHHSMSTYTAFDNNPIFWTDPSGADSAYGRQSNINWGTNSKFEKEKNQKKKVKQPKSIDDINNLFENARENGVTNYNFETGNETFLSESEVNDYVKTIKVLLKGINELWRKKTFNDELFSRNLDYKFVTDNAYNFSKGENISALLSKIKNHKGFGILSGNDMRVFFDMNDTSFEYTDNSFSTTIHNNVEIYLSLNTTELKLRNSGEVGDSSKENIFSFYGTPAALSHPYKIHLVGGWIGWKSQTKRQLYLDYWTNNAKKQVDLLLAKQKNNDKKHFAIFFITTLIFIM